MWLSCKVAMWRSGPPTPQHAKLLTQTMFEANANQRQNMYGAWINPSSLTRIQEIGHNHKGQISGPAAHAQNAKRSWQHERVHWEVAQILPEHHEHARRLHGVIGQLRLCDCVEGQQHNKDSELTLLWDSPQRTWLNMDMLQWKWKYCKHPYRLPNGYQGLRIIIHGSESKFNVWNQNWRLQIRRIHDLRLIYKAPNHNLRLRTKK